DPHARLRAVDEHRHAVVRRPAAGAPLRRRGRHAVADGGAAVAIRVATARVRADLAGDRGRRPARQRRDARSHDDPVDPRRSRDGAAKDIAGIVTLDGSATVFDRAAHVFVWQNTAGKLELHIYAAGKDIGTFPGELAGAIAPDPTATRIALATARGLSVLKLD